MSCAFNEYYGLINSRNSLWKWKIGKPIYMHQTPTKQFNNVLIVTELFWFIAAMIKITLYYMKNFCNLIGLE